MSQNPLLIGHGLPPFEQVKAEHVEPAVTQILAELETSVNELEANIKPTWEDFIEPLTRMEEKLMWTWGIIGHLMSVKNSPELREAYEKMQPSVVQFINRWSQSKPIYEGYKAIRESDNWSHLEPAQQRIIESSLREAELAGVGLEGETKEKFNAIQLELAELSTKFSNNTLDATKAFKLKLTDKADVAGLPDSALSLAAQTARSEGEENATPEAGPWVITLDYPSYLPFLKYAENRELREKVYKAAVSKASSGEFDNHPHIDRILELRKQKANLLGFDNFAELSLARKMAPSVEAVEKLMDELREVSFDAAKAELAELTTFSGQSELKHWDVAYWSEKQREAKFGFKAEELRPYFPLPQVLEGLFGLAQRLFSVTITAADGTAPVWHEDVRYFKISDESGTHIANFYLDPYSRPAEKRGGAWMNDCVGRAKIMLEGKVDTRLPVAYLICNQTPPVDGKPSLMTFGEVETLFHEFGHGLQHMLTHVDFPGAAGINNVEWDAVELPSQFMENWCYHRETLFGMAKHYETGETLPEHYYQKLLAARTYMSGSGMLRQLHFSLLDIELHAKYDPAGDETPEDVRNRLAETTTVMKPLPEDSFLCAFGHIFAGGYAAGYYSYKWAEVLSADAFSAFEEVGLEDEQAIATVGKKFRDTVLGLGGSLHPMEVFKKFRGREPQTEPLLRHSGLLQTA
ncbi:M3 family metallopeptidase [[Limnothrix rosea] IAM M-220]|uniref:M3 family metallopeptidase n=1 Tax=[Limnothrix rosea] IAM M-220 TaxID=454133 RepID=UPI00095F31A0|nr:M3 family metallopeptidase [[Limnothrix rosea] IAM M-220]OKH18438.1 peptidase M3 [[Limnothrix rosea] IAM M-220]